jgi:ferritin-like metal-binding protein YciE
MDRETLIARLRDVHAREARLIPVLQNQASDARDNPDAASKVNHQLEATRRHARMLEDCIRRMDESPSGPGRHEQGGRMAARDFTRRGQGREHQERDHGLQR